MWISPRPIIGYGCDEKSKSSGSWLEAAYLDCKTQPDIRLCVVSFTVGRSIQKVVDGDNIHLMVPFEKPSSEKFLELWNSIVRLFTPAVVQFWGTEMGYYQYVLDYFKSTPTLIYIQGLINKVYRSFFAGVSKSDVFRCMTLHDVIHRNGLLFSHKYFKSIAQIERINISKANGVIVENDWCADQIKAISPNTACYRSHLPIKQVFFERKWSLREMERHSIFCNAGGALFKGHHNLLKAFKLITEKYPDSKLYIPGAPVVDADLKKNATGYQRIIWHIINDNKLWDNIVFTGPLTSDDVADRLVRANVFVMPSIVENHSSSLIEALLVGTPSVSSFVGGTNSVATDECNALIFDHDDFESIAGKVLRIFDDDALACRLSKNAVDRMSKRPSKISRELLEIYNSCCRDEACHVSLHK